MKDEVKNLIKYKLKEVRLVLKLVSTNGLPTSEIENEPHYNIMMDLKQYTTNITFHQLLNDNKAY